MKTHHGRVHTNYECDLLNLQHVLTCTDTHHGDSYMPVCAVAKACINLYLR
jgi:hypothetical protein